VNLPIRARLTAWYVGLLALILAALGGFLVVRLRADLIHAVDQGLDLRAAQISLGLGSANGTGNGAGIGCEGEFRDVSDASLVALPQGESGAQLLGPGGAVLETSGDAVAEHPLLSPSDTVRVLEGHRIRASIASGSDLEPFRILAVRLISPSCRSVMVVATSLDDVRNSVRRLMILLLVAGPAALAAAGIGGWWLARRALRPVSAMTREAEELSVGRLDERIEVPRTADELQRLASTLNDLFDRLQRVLEEKRRFVADASHELRTPLAAMRAELDVSLRSERLDPAAREVLESADEEVVRMHRIVENLLTLARIDEGELPLLRESVDVREAAANAIASLDAFVALKRVRIELRGERVNVNADRARLEQVLVNLAHNAVKFSPPLGVVAISLRRDGSVAVCTVSDEGPGIENILIPRVFDRFVRGDPARTGDGGSGLGLAICREIVMAHGGKIWVDSRLGRGAAFSFSLPVAAEPLDAKTNPAERGTDVPHPA
jgi:heavy metal sensor kinase